MSDSSLRDALEDLIRDRSSNQGAVPSDYTIQPYELTELLAAHPAGSGTPVADESLGTRPQPTLDREKAQRLAAEWRQQADEDERYLNRAHASEIHDLYASIRINREHADAITDLLDGTEGAK